MLPSETKAASSNPLSSFSPLPRTQ
jgi:hypothetical protein